MSDGDYYKGKEVHLKIWVRENYKWDYSCYKLL